MRALPVEMEDHIFSFLDPWERFRIGLKTRLPELAFDLLLIRRRPTGCPVEEIKGPVRVVWATGKVIMMHGDREKAYDSGALRTCLRGNVRRLMKLPVRYNLRARKKRVVEVALFRPKWINVFTLTEDEDLFDCIAENIRGSVAQLVSASV